ncbi:MAG: response regulator [Patescibacteria group bacterium]
MEKQKILVVDDDPELLEILSESLRTAGFNVLSVNDTNEALEAISTGLQLDLVVCDKNAPALDAGLELLHQIQELKYGVKFILMSGDPDVTRRFEDPAALGLDGYFNKPPATSLKNIIVLIKQVLAAEIT